MQSLEDGSSTVILPLWGDFLIKPSDPEYIVEIQATAPIYETRPHEITTSQISNAPLTVEFLFKEHSGDPPGVRFPSNGYSSIWSHFAGWEQTGRTDFRNEIGRRRTDRYRSEAIGFRPTSWRPAYIRRVAEGAGSKKTRLVYAVSLCPRQTREPPGLIP